MVDSFLKGGVAKSGEASKGLSFGGKEVDLATLMQLGQAVMAAHNAVSGGGAPGGGGAGAVTGMLSQLGINPTVAGLAGNVMVRPALRCFCVAELPREAFYVPD
jgi:hypothetical protein